MTQTRYNLYNYSQAGEPNVHYVTAADVLDYLLPRDGITCLSINSGPPGQTASTTPLKRSLKSKHITQLR